MKICVILWFKHLSFLIRRVDKNEFDAYNYNGGTNYEWIRPDLRTSPGTGAILYEGRAGEDVPVQAPVQILPRWQTGMGPGVVEVRGTGIPQRTEGLGSELDTAARVRETKPAAAEISPTRPRPAEAQDTPVPAIPTEPVEKYLDKDIIPELKKAESAFDGIKGKMLIPEKPLSPIVNAYSSERTRPSLTIKLRASHKILDITV